MRESHGYTDYVPATEFARLLPSGWSCGREMPLLPPELGEVLGYAPRADVVLERPDRSQRLWIEFEVSRADPVANHAKFATAHLFNPQPPTDAFVAMVSPHVSRGRRNLASGTVLLMRRLGMNAFQTVLFPLTPPEEVKRLNHLGLSDVSAECPPVGPELERALCVSEPVLTVPGRRIHLAGDLLEVMMNLRGWNDELSTAEGAVLWGRRTITYFVFDPRSRAFAPSKFCAYVPVSSLAEPTDKPVPGLMRPLMTARLYVSLDGTTGKFDGLHARTHLCRRLAMIATTPEQAPEIAVNFDRWLAHHAERITLHPSGPVFLLPPAWFA